MTVSQGLEASRFSLEHASHVKPPRFQRLPAPEPLRGREPVAWAFTSAYHPQPGRHGDDSGPGLRGHVFGPETPYRRLSPSSECYVRPSPGYGRNRAALDLMEPSEPSPLVIGSAVSVLNKEPQLQLLLSRETKTSPRTIPRLTRAQGFRSLVPGLRTDHS